MLATFFERVLEPNGRDVDALNCEVESSVPMYAPGPGEGLGSGNRRLVPMLDVGAVFFTHGKLAIAAPGRHESKHEAA